MSAVGRELPRDPPGAASAKGPEAALRRWVADKQVPANNGRRPADRVKGVAPTTATPCLSSACPGRPESEKMPWSCRSDTLLMKTVTAAIAIKKQRVFLARRAQNQKLAGFWEFPGGKVEQQETLQECLERELREEFGVPSIVGATLCASIYHYADGSIRLVGIETAFLSTDFAPTVHDLK